MIGGHGGKNPTIILELFIKFKIIMCSVIRNIYVHTYIQGVPKKCSRFFIPHRRVLWIWNRYFSFYWGSSSTLQALNSLLDLQTDIGKWFEGKGVILEQEVRWTTSIII